MDEDIPQQYKQLEMYEKRPKNEPSSVKISEKSLFQENNAIYSQRDQNIHPPSINISQLSQIYTDFQKYKSIVTPKLLIFFNRWKNKCHNLNQNHHERFQKKTKEELSRNNLQHEDLSSDKNSLNEPKTNRFGLCIDPNHSPGQSKSSINISISNNSNRDFQSAILNKQSETNEYQSHYTRLNNQNSPKKGKNIKLLSSKQKQTKSQIDLQLFGLKFEQFKKEFYQTHSPNKIPDKLDHNENSNHLSDFSFSGSSYNDYILPKNTQKDTEKPLHYNKNNASLKSNSPKYSIVKSPKENNQRSSKVYSHKENNQKSSIDKSPKDVNQKYIKNTGNHKEIKHEEIQEKIIGKIPIYHAARITQRHDSDEFDTFKINKTQKSPIQTEEDLNSVLSSMGISPSINSNSFQYELLLSPGSPQSHNIINKSESPIEKESDSKQISTPVRNQPESYAIPSLNNSKKKKINTNNKPSKIDDNDENHSDDNHSDDNHSDENTLSKQIDNANESDPFSKCIAPSPPSKTPASHIKFDPDDNDEKIFNYSPIRTNPLYQFLDDEIVSPNEFSSDEHSSLSYSININEFEKDEEITQNPKSKTKQSQNSQQKSKEKTRKPSPTILNFPDDNEETDSSEAIEFLLK